MGHHGGGGMQFSDFGRHGLMLDSEVYMHIVLRMLTWNQNCSRAVFATGSLVVEKVAVVVICKLFTLVFKTFHSLMTEEERINFVRDPWCHVASRKRGGGRGKLQWK